MSEKNQARLISPYLKAGAFRRFLGNGMRDSIKLSPRSREVKCDVTNIPIRLCHLKVNGPCLATCSKQLHWVFA
jgi:hypothetical protein